MNQGGFSNIVVGIIAFLFVAVGGYFLLTQTQKQDISIADLQHRDNYLNCAKPCMPTYKQSPNAELDIQEAQCSLKCQNDFKLGACINSCEEGSFGDRPVNECIQQVCYPNYR